MSPIQKLLSALAKLARLANKETTAEYLELASVVAGAAADDKEQFAAITSEIEGMVAAGRDPTDEERKAVRDRRDALQQEIDALAAAGQ